MPSKNSRPARWAKAAGELREKMENVSEATAEMADALQELNSLQEEYNDWYSNLPDSLQQGPTGELLAEIGNLDVPDEATIDNIADVSNFLDEAEAIQLPAGFGRD